MKIHSIYYHNPSPTKFERMLKWYIRKGYRFISMDEFLNVYKSSSILLEKLCLITIDDGWQGNMDLLPVIERYSVPVTIFVSTEPISSGNFWSEYIIKERGRNEMIEFKKLPYEEFNRQLDNAKRCIKLDRSAITIEQLKELKNHPLVSIHSHTVNHPILTNVPDDVLDMELKDSQHFLETVTKRRVYAFSYPNGSLTQREMLASKKYYEIAFTTEMRHISKDDNPFLLPRVALTGDFYRDLLKISGIWKYIKKILLFLRISKE